MDLEQHHRDTLLQHFAEEDKPHGAVVPPIYQNSLFVFPDYDTFWDTCINNPAGPPYHYSRLGNPTLDVVEQKIAMLEGTEAAKVFGGGMAAISLAILSCVQQGSHVLAVDTCYKPARIMLEEYLVKFGVETTFFDGRCIEELLDNIRPETSLIYLESPTSFVFRLQDLEKIAKVAREKGIPTVVDNTYSTPLFCNPHALGIDMIVHSASKYLSGHSDLTAGVICASAQRIDSLVRKEVNIFSSLLSPFGAWLLLRGLRTLTLRVNAHQASANAVARFLEDQPEVEQVFHVGLESFPQRELFKKQMRGTSSLLSFQPKRQDMPYIRRLANSLKLFRLGVSWGGFESLVVPLEVQPKDWPEPRYLIRLHVGLEDVRDLVADLRQAFDAADEAG